MAKERKDLEDEKKQLTRSNALMAKELKELQEAILSMLQSSEGDILEEVELIDTLERSRDKSLEINQKMEAQKSTEATIDDMRNQYRPVAFRGATLFFCAAALAAVDPMYQYLLHW